MILWRILQIAALLCHDALATTSYDRDESRATDLGLLQTSLKMHVDLAAQDNTLPDQDADLIASPGTRAAQEADALLKQLRGWAHSHDGSPFPDILKNISTSLNSSSCRRCKETFTANNGCETLLANKTSTKDLSRWESSGCLKCAPWAVKHCRVQAILSKMKEDLKKLHKAKTKTSCEACDWMIAADGSCESLLSNQTTTEDLARWESTGCLRCAGSAAEYCKAQAATTTAMLAPTTTTVPETTLPETTTSTTEVPCNECDVTIAADGGCAAVLYNQTTTEDLSRWESLGCLSCATSAVEYCKSVFPTTTESAATTTTEVATTTPAETSTVSTTVATTTTAETTIVSTTVATTTEAETSTVSTTVATTTTGEVSVVCSESFPICLSSGHCVTSDCSEGKCDFRANVTFQIGTGGEDTHCTGDYQVSTYCPERFPSCFGPSGDCVVPKCSTGGCTWEERVNFQYGYDGVGTDCTGDFGTHLLYCTVSDSISLNSVSSKCVQCLATCIAGPETEKEQCLSDCYPDATNATRLVNIIKGADATWTEGPGAPLLKAIGELVESLKSSPKVPAITTAAEVLKAIRGTTTVTTTPAQFLISVVDITACPPSYLPIQNHLKCEVAAKALNADYGGTGSWGLSAFGCFAQHNVGDAEWSVSFNDNIGGPPNQIEMPVCVQQTCEEYECKTKSWIKKVGVANVTDPTESKCCARPFTFGDLNSSACTSHFEELVTSASDCERAAQALGRSYYGVATSSLRPFGCIADSYATNGQWWVSFNNDTSGSPNPASMPVCQAKVGM